MKALASWTSGSRLRADQALLGAHIAAEGGGGRCCSTHTVSRNQLSLWGYRWGQLWTRKFSLNILISAILPRAHTHPLSLPVHLE